MGYIFIRLHKRLRPWPWRNPCLRIVILSAIDLPCFDESGSPADDPLKPRRRWVWFLGTRGLPVGLHFSFISSKNLGVIGTMPYLEGRQSVVLSGDTEDLVTMEGFVAGVQRGRGTTMNKTSLPEVQSRAFLRTLWIWVWTSRTGKKEILK